MKKILISSPNFQWSSKSQTSYQNLRSSNKKPLRKIQDSANLKAKKITSQYKQPKEHKNGPKIIFFYFVNNSENDCQECSAEFEISKLFFFP